MTKHELREELYSILSNDFSIEDLIDAIWKFKQLSENETVNLISIIAAQSCGTTVEKMKAKTRKRIDAAPRNVRLR